MTWVQFWTTVLVWSYFAGMFGGWGVSALAALSTRYRPAASCLGAAVGILPTHLLVLWAVRRAGWVAPTATLQQLAAFALAALSVLVMCGIAAAILQRSIRDERTGRVVVVRFPPEAPGAG